jgi:hypothetical protein
MFDWCAAMTPNLTNPPWYVDLWIDQDGQIIPEVAGRYLSQSNSRWAAEMAAAGGELEIFMSAGDEDFYLPFTTYFANDLDSLGIPYTLHMFHGEHDTNLFKPHLTFFIPLNATVEIQPDTLNCRSNGRWVTAYIELPGDLSVGEIDLSTLTINGVNGSDLDTPIQQEGPTSVSDVNGNGVPDLMVKFDRGDLVDGIGGLTSWSEPSVTVTIEGNLINGWFLEAEDSVQLVCNRRRPAGAD